MEMSSAQWLSELGFEDSALVRQPDDLSEGTAEQVPAFLGYQNEFDVDAGWSLTGYPNYTINVPPTLSQQDLYHISKQVNKTSNNWDSSSSASASSSSHAHQPQFCGNVPNSQQIPTNYRISSLVKLKDDANDYNNNNTHLVAPNTPSMQSEIMADSCISDISYSANSSAFNFSSSTGNFLIPNQAFPGAGNRHSNGKMKTSAHNEEHIMAERRRREKLSQKFIALSAILPGLKKIDKASVLGDAIKYVKQLQEKLKVLEDQLPKKTVQSVVYVNKAELSSNRNDDDKPVSSSREDGTGGVVLRPEIEARVVKRNILIRIHCQKKKGLLVKALAELENLELTVVNASILSFSETTLDLTFNAKMEEGCDLTVTEIVKALQTLFNNTT